MKIFKTLLSLFHKACCLVQQSQKVTVISHLRELPKLKRKYFDSEVIDMLEEE
jgi:hypothetical protein